MPKGDLIYVTCANYHDITSDVVEITLGWAQKFLVPKSSGICEETKFSSPKPSGWGSLDVSVYGKERILMAAFIWSM